MMEDKVKAHREEMKAIMEAWLEESKVCWEVMEVSQETTEATVEHCKGVPRTEATRLLTALQSQASDVLH
jgi:hypothetical protein